MYGNLSNDEVKATSLSQLRRRALHSVGSPQEELESWKEDQHGDYLETAKSDGMVDELEASAIESSEGHNSHDTRRKMWRNELRLGTANNSPQLKNTRQQRRHNLLINVVDILVRGIMVIFFIYLERRPAFRRKVAIEELYKYKFPRTPDYVSGEALLISVIIGPFVTTLLLWLIRRDRRDFRAASWAWTLSLCLNGIATSLIKVSVGRPRPDFFARCFPDDHAILWPNNSDSMRMLGVANVGVYTFNCTGNARDVNEGFKSFPSGHASFAFTSYGFIAFYVGAKLHAFNIKGRGQTWRLIIALTPLVLAALVAISRTCDYHHHSEDVFVGSVIGLLTSYAAYRQYYPSIFALDAAVPFQRNGSVGNGTSSANNGGYRLLEDESVSEDADNHANKSPRCNCRSDDSYNSPPLLLSEKRSELIEHN